MAEQADVSYVGLSRVEPSALVARPLRDVKLDIASWLTIGTGSPLTEMAQLDATRIGHFGAPVRAAYPRRRIPGRASVACDLLARSGDPRLDRRAALGRQHDDLHVGVAASRSLPGLASAS